MPLGWGQAENESARVNDCICLLSESFSSGTKSTSIRLQFDKDRENGLIFNFQEVSKKFRVIDPFKKLQMLWEYVGLCVNGEVLVPVGFTDVGEPRTTLISVTYCYITYSCEHLWKETHTQYLGFKIQHRPRQRSLIPFGWVLLSFYVETGFSKIARDTSGLF